MEFLRVVTLADSTYVLYPADAIQLTVSAAHLITAAAILDTADGSTTAIDLTNKRADLVCFDKRHGYHTILSSGASAT